MNAGAIHWTKDEFTISDKRPALVLLPGMDGTGELFAYFQASLPADVRAIPIAYPRDRPLGYDELLPIVRDLLPDEPFVLVAESFSGPIGIMIAAERPSMLKGLVLCASFARSPLPLIQPWLSWLVRPLLFRFPPTALLVRWLLLDRRASPNLVADVRLAVASVNPAVLAHRLREILNVDVRDLLAEVAVPISYVAGSRDRLLGQHCAKQLKAALANASISTIDGPHLLLQANPREAAVEILAVCDHEFTN